MIGVADALLWVHLDDDDGVSYWSDNQSHDNRVYISKLGWSRLSYDSIPGQNFTLHSFCTENMLMNLLSACRMPVMVIRELVSFLRDIHLTRYD